jgi:RNA polymerase sigma-70 factor (ECF subfamily)
MHSREIPGPGTQREDQECITSILTAQNWEQAESGYRRLQQKYWPVVTFLMRGQVGDHQEAEDIAQEAFLRAFRSLGKLKEPAAFLGWLMRIARNLATDHLRGRKPTLSLDALRDRAGDAEFGKIAAFGARTGTPPEWEQKLERGEEVELVMRALEQLPDRYREVIALKYIQDLDGRSMARLLGEPEGTIRNRLFRALEKLREGLKHGLEPRVAAEGACRPHRDGET